MKIMKLTILFLYTCLFSINKIAVAQTAKAVVEKSAIKIGEQFKITISANDIKTNQTQIIQWFNEFKDTSNHFEVIKKTSIDTLLFNGVYHYHQSYIITSFDSGVFNIPVFTIQFKSIYADSVITKQTEPIEITVLPVDVSHLKTYNDVTDIIPVESNNENLIRYTIVGVIIFSIITLVSFLYLKFGKRKKKVTQKVSNQYLNEAMEKLALLEKSMQNEKAKDFFNTLYHIIRNYYSFEFQDPSVINCTTTEWLSVISKLSLNPSLQNELTSFFKQADDIRFTDNISLNEEKKAIDTVRQLIESLHNFKHNN